MVVIELPVEPYASEQLGRSLTGRKCNCSREVMLSHVMWVG